MVTYPQRIQVPRVERGLSVAEVAEEAGVRVVTDLSDLHARTLAEFVASLDGRADATRANALHTVGNLLLSFPAASEALGFNPAGVLSCLHIPKDATLPSVYPASEVSAALAAIDRDTAP